MMDTGQLELSRNQGYP
ncbi:hypothetical protein M8C21_031597 [Ambrosia artemisiifolia]|uniref:Uncharacterized protein n=1 Tax=Ambrosia artemisiifolia TaxID=4212 RepID=A0AAD5CAN3_AMBAR|nr:hypothetical protein M8C21_031597 [Ambrosia artemisiifolia]